MKTLIRNGTVVTANEATLNSYWWLVLNDKQGEADALFQEQAKRGVPLP